MNNQFDEFTKSLARSVTRRGALKKFGVGLAGMALVCFGLTNKAEAARGDKGSCYKKCMRDCPNQGGDPLRCPDYCTAKCFLF